MLFHSIPTAHPATTQGQPHARHRGGRGEHPSSRKTTWFPPLGKTRPLPATALVFSVLAVNNFKLSWHFASNLKAANPEVWGVCGSDMGGDSVILVFCFESKHS